MRELARGSCTEKVHRRINAPPRPEEIAFPASISVVDARRPVSRIGTEPLEFFNIRIKRRISYSLSLFLFLPLIVSHNYEEETGSAPSFTLR